MPLTTVPSTPVAYFLTHKRIQVRASGAGMFTSQAMTGWGGAVWVLLVDNVFSQPFVIPDSRRVSVPFTVDVGQETHFIYVICLGWWPEPPARAPLDLVRANLEDAVATAIEVEIPTAATIRGAYDDEDQFSNWVLTGLRRFTNTERVANWKTRASLGLVLSSAGSDYTVELYQGARKVASGSRTGNGEVSLSEEDESGISGTVDLAYSQDLALTDGAYVLATWAASFQIYDGTDLLATAWDNGRANRLRRRLDNLDPDTYSIRLKSVSDAGNTSSYGSSAAATINPLPPTPATAVYLSGNYTNTQIRITSPTPAWAASTAYAKRAWVTPSGGPAGYAYECTTAGTSAADEPSWPTTPGQTVEDGTITWTCREEVTYAVYDSALDEPSDVSNVNGHKKTASAAAGNVDVSLDTLAAAAAGVRRVQIHCVSDGIQDPVGLTLEIEYDASGDVVPVAPNDPAVALRSISGRTVTLGYVYDPGDQSVAPATVKMWLVAEGATPDWNTPDVSQDIASAQPSGRINSTIQDTADADGFYRWVVRVADASGNLSPATTLSDALWVGTAADAAPTPELHLAG